MVTLGKVVLALIRLCTLLRSFFGFSCAGFRIAVRVTWDVVESLGDIVEGFGGFDSTLMFWVWGASRLQPSTPKLYLEVHGQL